jgi:hypothetical protein
LWLVHAASSAPCQLCRLVSRVCFAQLVCVLLKDVEWRCNCAIMISLCGALPPTPFLAILGTSHTTRIYAGGTELAPTALHLPD